MPQIAKTVHEGRTAPITFTLKDSAGVAIDLVVGTYPKIELIIVQGTRRITVNTTDNPTRLSVNSPTTNGEVVFTPLAEDPDDPTYQAGDQGLHLHLFRLYTSALAWFGVPDGKFIVIRAITG